MIKEYKLFKKDHTSASRALDLCNNAWHMTDWVFREYKSVHLQPTLGKFRETLYPECNALKIMHDIANGSKHLTLDFGREKGDIKDTRTTYTEEFTCEFTSEFGDTIHQVELNNGSMLNIQDEIGQVVSFWINYFHTKLDILV
ncbi:hypothetical protein [Daejeonella oryzae]|uniref:hypothetical protein n=1 Tax=Daejeonella oryzae TaxID=1122943 RepID=UPI00138AED06|nr:hypothetical protein [Daejeonella oryzae]